MSRVSLPRASAPSSSSALADRGEVVDPHATLARARAHDAACASALPVETLVQALAVARFGPPERARAASVEARRELRRVLAVARSRERPGVRLRSALSLRSFRPGLTPFGTMTRMSAAYDLFQQGRTHLRSGMPAQATVALEKAKRLEPEKASIREALGIAYFRLSRWSEAEEEFRKVLELSPADDYAHYALGRALRNQGRHDEARGHLKLARSLRPRGTDEPSSSLDDSDSTQGSRSATTDA